MYADIIVNISHEALDRTFQYIVPEELRDEVDVGAYVRFPFGRGNRPLEGYVLSLGSEPKVAPEKLKALTEVLHDSEFAEGKLIKTAAFIRERYGSTMLQAMRTVFPIRKAMSHKEQKSIRLLLSETEAEPVLETYVKKHRTARERLLRALLENGDLDYRLVTGKLHISTAAINAMQEQGVIGIEVKRVYRNQTVEADVSPAVSLNEEQQRIVTSVSEDYRAGKRGVYLIRGVTGSGKTEVYMEIIDKVLSSGRQVIVLIPEIALTFQTLMRFYRRFGDRVSTLHSRLSEGERYDQFERAKRGEISIMIGPRSALFTPFSNLGLIVIDEEHEGSYKSELSPKYHAREVAIALAGFHGASVLLGSATPSVDSYYAALNGEYRLFTLNRRAKEEARLADVQVVDLREEFRAGNKSMFSRALTDGIEDRLNRNEQVMLFLNRRGLAGFISCRSCGHVIKCPHCDVALSRHGGGTLLCHYCGFSQPDVKLCPECGSPYIGAMRAGTEQIEAQIKKLYPFASTLRMDADTTKHKDDYERILNAFANREADILIGTQMIVKGHDFPYVTLMGILAADMSLYGSDYRATERTFSLLTQAAGRAGRDKREGLVIIQTYHPEHFCIKTAASQDYEAFYREEIAFRKLLHYPPAAHLLVLLAEGKDEEKTESFLRDLAEQVKNVIINNCVDSGIRIIGPAEASLRKLNDVFRYVMYLKGESLQELIRIKDELAAGAGARQDAVRLSFDLDPMNGY
ncbi:MAG: primosomal protein N' [Lachnospiraceae bacterium]|nr:primosomal protein N' [Lachnospiraceae bacterium]